VVGGGQQLVEIARVEPSAATPIEIVTERDRRPCRWLTVPSLPVPSLPVHSLRVPSLTGVTIREIFSRSRS